MAPARSRWQEIRAAHPEFHYQGFQVEESGASLRVRFDFRIPPDIEFHPELVISGSHALPRKLPTGVIDNLVFHLGLIESISYWKAACSPRIIVRPGMLDETQASWWQDLVIHGMGEFFFVNGIDFAGPGFVAFEGAGPPFPLLEERPLRRSLLPIGGGRDSGVAGMVFARSGLPTGCLLLNPTPAAKAIVERICPVETITVQRAIDPRLLELNAAGFLNGHTPFSAYLAFLSALCAALFDYQDIVLANEHSSNEGNTEYLGRIINHQYSKSLRFEERFDSYLRQYIAPELRYFSFMRPLGELQIGHALARFPELFGAIKSCNRNPASLEWCGNCPKCLSVFVTTYPFVAYEDVLKVFGRDFFENAGSVAIMRQLAGLDAHKPFECVCSYDEFIAGLELCVRACKASGRALPQCLARAETEILGRRVGASVDAAAMLKASAPHRIPTEFQPLLAGLY